MTSLNIGASIIFALALLQTFLSAGVRGLAAAVRQNSLLSKALYFAGEVELIFGFWALVFLIFFVIQSSSSDALAYLKGLSFREPFFVSVVLIIAASLPIIRLAETVIYKISMVFSNRSMGLYFASLVLGPLLGSFITEPAAMVVTAMVLKDNFMDAKASPKFLYLSVGILFVNVSIGGVLTHFAAPPVVMVAHRWGWDSGFMMAHFGWKAVVAIIINAVLGTYILRSELRHRPVKAPTLKSSKVSFLYVVFLVAAVLTSHFSQILLGIFVGFLICNILISKNFKSLKLKEGFFVGIFLSGLVVLGSLQSWWIEPLIHRLSMIQLYLSSIALTSITDNAALTFLGANIVGLEGGFKYFLVAGAVVGGGLTVIANAPNPAGNAILEDAFGPEGITPGKLFVAALGPTLIALVMFLI